MTVQKKELRSDITALRAVAVTLVMLSHFGIPGFEFGFIGVDVFFVISGFLITGVLYNEYITSARGDPLKSTIALSNFYLRRIRRLLPAAFTVIIAVNILSFFMSNPVSRSALFTTSKWSAIFLANVSFLRSGADYFQQANEPSMLQHYWSLSVEEQFYFIWPLLFLLSANFQRFKIRKRFIRFNVRLLTLIIFLSLISFILMLISFNQSPIETYFAIFTRAWELGVGSFFGLLAFHKKSTSIHSPLEQYLPFIAGILVVSMIISDRNWAYLVPIPVITTGYFLYAGHGRQLERPPLGKFMIYIRRFIIYLGTISYSLYLVHWPLYIISSRLDIPNKVLVSITLFPISIFFAHLLWKQIEVPFQKIKLPSTNSWDEPIFKFIKSKRIVIGSLIIFTLSSLYIVTYPSVSEKFFYSDSNLKALQNDPNLKIYSDYQSQILRPESVVTVETLPTSDSSTAVGTSNLSDLQLKIITSLNEGLKSTKLTPNEIGIFGGLSRDLNRFELSGCANSFLEVPMNCYVPATSPTAKSVALIGDSKMSMIEPVISDYFSKKGWNVRPLNMNGCHMSDPSKSEVKNCDARSKWVLNEIKSKKYSLVISSEWPGSDDLRNVTSYFKSIQNSVDKLIIFQTNSRTKAPKDCVTSDYVIGSECTDVSPLIVKTMLEHQSALRALAAPNTVIIESQKWICVDLRCPLTVDGVFVRRDGSHITNSYLTKIAPLIVATLDSISNW